MNDIDDNNPDDNYSIRDSFMMLGAPIKEGVLCKKRDHLKGWRSRYFVLDEKFLHYYVEKGGVIPRNSMQITGVKISRLPETKMVNGIEYFLFVISHPASKDFILSTTSLLDCNEWIEALTSVANKKPSISTITKKSNVVHRLLPDDIIQKGISASSGDSVTSDKDPVNKDATLRNIPQKYNKKVEIAVATLLSGAEEDDWLLMFEKSGVKATRKSGTGSLCVKGEMFMPYTICELYSICSDEFKRKDLDAQLDIYKRMLFVSHHTGVEHILFKPVWPTAARDFLNITHWRLLQNGTFVTLGFSDQMGDFYPPKSGVVRGDLIIGGYVFIPVLGGTRVFIIVQSDLGGSLPSSVCNLAAQSQPLVLVTLRKLLDSAFRDVPRPSPTVVPVTKYEDLINIILKNNPGKSFDGQLPNSQNEEYVSNKEKMKNDTANDTSNSVKNGIQTEISANRIKRHSRNIHSDTLFWILAFIPLCLQFMITSWTMRCVVLVGGYILIFEYAIRMHTGKSKRKINYIAPRFVASPTGHKLHSFIVDLGNLLHYIEHYRISMKTDISITHIMTKAVGIVLSEFPRMHGYVIDDTFYSSIDDRIDIGVSMDTAHNDTVIVKLVDVDSKSLSLIAKETEESYEEVKKYNVESSFIASMIPSYVCLQFIQNIITILSGKYGFSIPFTGIKGFPYGHATIVNLSSKDNLTSDHAVQLAMICNMKNSSCPITVSIGGVRLVPISDTSGDKKMRYVQGLHVAVSIDNLAGSLDDGKKFVSRLNQLLNSPKLLEQPTFAQ